MSTDGYTARTLTSKGDYWYLCDVCGRPVRGKLTTRQVRTLEQRGLRVCKRRSCLDDPGVNDYLDEAATNLRNAAYEDGRPKPP